MSSDWAGSGKSYTDFMKVQGNQVDFISIQYYNQGLYKDNPDNALFNIDSWADGSSRRELVDAGIPKNKLVMGKPISEATAFSGFVPATTIQRAACRAHEEFGWDGGFMTWMYDTDLKEQAHNWSKELMTPCQPCDAV